MDFLQIALIFLILLLSIFLAITGIQVFFILKDLKKALDRFNNMLKSGENIAEDIERPIGAVSDLATSIGGGAKVASDIVSRVISGLVKRDPKPKPKRFYKKIL